MAITLDQFRTISNGTYNVGQIMLTDDGNGLQKINNHVWQTGKNNVQTTAADNRKVRQALLDAFKSDERIPDELKEQIKYILLGEGRSARSLGRDFVKKLIATATDESKFNDNIISDMENVEKSLRNRNITQTNNPNTPLRELMTSTKDVAFEKYASEAMDNAAAKAHDGLTAIRSPMSQVVVAVSNGVSYAVSGINGMLQQDCRLVGNPNVTPLCNELLALSRLFYPQNSGTANLLYGQAKAAALFERKVRELYARHNIPEDIRNDHFARIFIRQGFVTKNAEVLRQLFTDVSTDRIIGCDLGDEENNLAKLYSNFLDTMISSVESSNSLSQDAKNVALDRLNGLKGAENQPSARMMEMMNLGQEARLENKADATILLIKKVEEHLTEDIKNVFRDCPNANFIVSNYLDAFSSLGLGV